MLSSNHHHLQCPTDANTHAHAHLLPPPIPTLTHSMTPPSPHLPRWPPDLYRGPETFVRGPFGASHALRARVGIYAGVPSDLTVHPVSGELTCGVDIESCLYGDHDLRQIVLLHRLLL